MRIDDNVLYREGVVLDRPVGQSKGSLVNAGARKEVRIDKCLRPGLRVTVKMMTEHKNGTLMKYSLPQAAQAFGFF